MEKVSVFRGETEHGQLVVPLHGPADSVFEKTAAPTLLPEVATYIAVLKPRNDAQYVLVNAMGAGEYYGSNVNGDHFPEASLIHAPDDWSGNAILDRIKHKEWPYGYPTFYGAHPYAHHKNKDSSRAFGEVELTAWNPHMRRVELVVRLDKDKCERFGAVPIWDKIRAGHFPDVSMGCKVPYDTCSICLDWDRYRAAQATFNKKKHKHPGDAVLEEHKKKPIRGVAITRADYCEHCRGGMNRILPDGRKIFVYNDYPRFFDISFVFIGADRTAKVMLKIAEGGQLKLASVSDEALISWTEESEEGVKTASVEDESLKTAFLGKSATQKKESEIEKDVIPSQFAGKAVPLLTAHEKDLPDDVIDALAGKPLNEALSTTSQLGMVLRPREFQRMILLRLGLRKEADHLEECGHLFPHCEESEDLQLSPTDFSPTLARLLLPLLSSRSAFGPEVERRAVVVLQMPGEKVKKASSLSSPLLRKIGAAYNGYRQSIMDLVAHAQPTLSESGLLDGDVQKLAAEDVNELFTPLAAQYLKHAFMNELPETTATAVDAERGSPSRNAFTTTRSIDR
jgi:hypothetical protein